MTPHPLRQFSVGSGYFFAERHAGLTFSRVVWHAAGEEQVVLDFVNGFYLANDIADRMNRRLTPHVDLMAHING